MPEAPKTMSEVKKQSAALNVAETTEPKDDPKKQEEPKAPPAEKTDAKSKTAPDEIEIDYKAELEKAKSALEREKQVREWERAERHKVQEALRRITSPQPASSKETPQSVQATPVKGDDLSEADLVSLVDQRFEALKRSQVSDFIQDLLPDLSDDQSEQELIRHIYENEIRPSGYSRKSVEADLRKAYLIANAKRLEEIAFRKAKAKVRAEVAQEKALSGSASRGVVGREPPAPAAPNYSEFEKKLLSRVGKQKADGD